MSSFYNIGIKTINDYKALLRRNLPSNVSAAKIKDFGLKRKQLKQLDEAGLLDICNKILLDLENGLNATRNKCNNYYSGTEEFVSHLKKIISNHSKQGKQVVNPSQKASCALVSAIQLIALSKNDLDERTSKKLLDHSRFVAKHGNREQVMMLVTAIKKNLPQKSLLLNKLKDDFAEHFVN